MSRSVSIATYNIWHHPHKRQERFNALCAEIKQHQPDILLLQEVMSTFQPDEPFVSIAEHLAQSTGYPYWMMDPYMDSLDEGLAILTKLPFERTDSSAVATRNINHHCAIRIPFTIDDIHFAVTNIHFNWRASDIRLDQLQFVNAWIASQSNDETIEFLGGDFNDGPGSLLHQAALQDWVDLADSFAARTGQTAATTLDPVTNPYLKKNDGVTIPVRYDWLLCQRSPSPVTLQQVRLIGNHRLPHHLLPSDHYGVFAQLRLH
ncbi:endonuclease/exonuclease/phosphatase family protein [Exiguobacterium sp. TDN 0502]|uniref:endonuclease/exonuclease/phosphatase family protein n=1 Tax=Exiguobacterium sp. TDN 0502 TaxID=3420731 RepID=UPI003D77D165